MGEETVLFDGFFDREDLREVFVLHENSTSSCSSTGFAVRYNKTDWLARCENFVNGKEDFYQLMRIS
jgi:hypothetical protein